MNKRTNYNSIFFLTTLGVYLVLGLVLTAFPVYAQEKSTKETEINRKPLEDFAEMLRKEIVRGETDFDKPFLVEAELNLTNDGKIDTSKFKFVRIEGDAKMAEIAKTAIAAIGDSGFFAYLQHQGIDKFTFSMQQTDQTFSSIIKSEQQTTARANSLASGLNTILKAVSLIDNQGIKKLDDNSRVLVSNTRITSEEKNVILNFSMPKAEFHQLILRSVKKPKEKC